MTPVCTIWYMPIQSRITTTATADRVWSVLSELDAWPQWLPTVNRLEREDPDAPHGVGAAYRLEQPRLPRARWVVTEWTPGEGLTWTSSGPGVTTTATHELGPAPSGGTEIVLGISWSGPLGGLLGLLYGRLTRRYLETEVAALADRATA